MGKKVKVNLAVCGAFHYRKYVRYLDEAQILKKFYYSHRLHTTAVDLGIAHDRAANLWLKEYAVQFHGMVTRGRWIAQFAPLYADLWQLGVLRRWNPCDILHLMLHGTGLKLIRRAKREGSKVIIEPVNQHPVRINEILCEEAYVLGMRAHPALYRIQERQLEEAAQSDFLLAPSRIVRDSFIKRGYDENRTRVLHYGVDLNAFHPIPGADELQRTFRVICVAQVSARKGQLYLLEAWKQLRLSDAELLLIGAISSPMDVVLRRYAGMFRHIPFVANNELLEYYGRSSVFVLPTLEDGFAVATAEAMACGLPVITTANNGAADIITHGKDGFIVPVRSPEALAEHLDLLYRDRELTREMAKSAASKASSELGWDKYASRLLQVYHSVLNGRSETQCLTPGDEAGMEMSQVLGQKTGSR
jgi:glycosyltransferase involved in cell wall biosynthesis